MEKPGFPKLDVMIIDPSPHMTGLVASMLRHLKVRHIVELQDSGTALAVLATRRFGAIMVNDVLTPLSGTELTRQLRETADSPNRSTPVIMMSNAPDAAGIAAARDAGISEFLRKPFAAAHIETRLNAITATPRDFIATDSYAGPDRRRKKLRPRAERRGARPPA